jgi:hypothetical protein
MPRRARHLLATLVAVGVLGTGALGATPAGAAPPPPSADTSVLSELDEMIGALGDRVLELARAKAAEAAEQQAAEEAAAAQAAAPPCNQLAHPDIPKLVAEVFRCRLREAGFPEPEIARIAAEAVTVAQCESLWNPNAIVFDGRYLHARHPATGMFYSAAGVFQFIRRVADLWVEGGYANVLNPTANIDAAARLYIHNRVRGYGGWDDWACAAANDGFRATSVLPGWPGGPPALPDWAFTV